jgi:hypothetical protein
MKQYSITGNPNAKMIMGERASARVGWNCRTIPATAKEMNITAMAAAKRIMSWRW